MIVNSGFPKLCDFTFIILVYNQQHPLYTFACAHKSILLHVYIKSILVHVHIKSILLHVHIKSISQVYILCSFPHTEHCVCSFIKSALCIIIARRSYCYYAILCCYHAAATADAIYWTFTLGCQLISPLMSTV